jgi:hypothetical protein
MHIHGRLLSARLGSAERNRAATPVAGNHQSSARAGQEQTKKNQKNALVWLHFKLKGLRFRDSRGPLEKTSESRTFAFRIYYGGLHAPAWPERSAQK